MVESLSAEYLGTYGNKQNITPHLDKLIKKSLFFNAFLNRNAMPLWGIKRGAWGVSPPTHIPKLSLLFRSEISLGIVGNTLNKSYLTRFETM